MFLEKQWCKYLWILVLEGKTTVTVILKIILRVVEKPQGLWLVFRFVFSLLLRGGKQNSRVAKVIFLTCL